MSSNELNEIDQYPDEINIKDLTFALIAQKKFIFIFTALFACSSIYFSLTVSENWSSSALLTPASSVGMSGGGSSGASGLGALAGISISPKGGATPSSKASATIRSRDFLKHLLGLDGVLKNLMAFESYDKSSQKSNYNKSLYDVEKEIWIDGMKPTFQEAFSVYQSSLSVRIEKATGFLTIGMSHGSPIFAKEFLDLIIQEVNNISRIRDLNDSEESLTYLYGQLSSIQQSEVKVSVSQIIESQLKKQMMASIKKNYILEPIDSAFIPELRSYPQRSKMVITWTIIGFILSIIIVIGRHQTLKYYK